MQKKNSVSKLPLPLSEARTTTFWRHALALHGSITPHVIPNVCIIGGLASVVSIASAILDSTWGIKIGLAIAPYEYVGAALGLLLVLRTNAGYDRWWEARKLWGGIVNQCRNIAVSGLSYGPTDPRWQDEFIGWVAVFPQAARTSLRGQRLSSLSISVLNNKDNVEPLLSAQHQPLFVARRIAECLKSACDEKKLDGFAFMQIDRERAQLIDHLGACERIVKTPLALAYSIKIRRFILMFLLTLPFALIHQAGPVWMVPVITMLVAYPLFSLDQLGAELQNPFDVNNLSHLPLDEISQTIELNVMSLLKSACKAKQI